MAHLITPDSLVVVSDDEDEYMILDIYDISILDKSNPLNGLAILNYESKTPTIVIDGNKHVGQSISIGDKTPAMAIFNVDNNNRENVTGVGHVTRHIVLGDPESYRSTDPAFVIDQQQQQQKPQSKEGNQQQTSSKKPTKGNDNDAEQKSTTVSKATKGGRRVSRRGDGEEKWMTIGLLLLMMSCIRIGTSAPIISTIYSRDINVIPRSNPSWSEWSCYLLTMLILSDNFLVILVTMALPTQITFSLTQGGESWFGRRVPLIQVL